jgi:outer membrane protein assembly factor BamE (lipoprotein component of BamABCDE complex)
MNRTITRFAALVSVATLAACVSQGDLAIKDIDRQKAAALLHPGISTKAEVERALGTAKTNQFSSGYEVWTYRYTQVTPKATSFVPVLVLAVQGSNQRTRELAILFDEKGIVKKFRVREQANAQ